MAEKKPAKKKKGRKREEEAESNVRSPEQSSEGWTREEMEAAEPIPLPEVPDDDEPEAKSQSDG